MKQVIKHFYGFEEMNLKSDNDAYYFAYNNKLYYFVPFGRKESEIKDIINVINELKRINFLCHDIIYNKFNKAITVNNNKSYILLNVSKKFDLEISIFDMINTNKRLRLSDNQKKFYKNNWKSLWENKIDYFEQQIRMYGKDKDGILNTFSYYIGLAETAIEYVAQVEKNFYQRDNDLIVLSHRRIFWPNYGLNYLNPISFLLDLEVRDYAEYFKSAFFKNINIKEIKEEFSSFLKIVNLGEYSYNMLFARFLFPSNYFDIFEKLMEGDAGEEELINVVNNSHEYEKFLCFIFDELSKYTRLIRVPWIVNKKIIN